MHCKTKTIVAGAVVSLCLAACGSSDGPVATAEIRTLSADPNVVSAGNTSVSVSVPAGAGAADISLRLNGQDVSDKLALDTASGTMRGVVGGLVPGKNSFEAQVGTGPKTTLAVQNHPAGGPVFSGPQLKPWVCTTASSGLGPALDDQCNVAPSFKYYYMSKSKEMFLPYTLQSPPPAGDIASIKTDRDVTANYIVRVESGSVDRSSYEIAVLYDPSRTGAAALDGWNHKLYVPLQGGFGHVFSQGFVRSNTPQEAILNDMALRRGFAVAKTSFLQALTNMDWVRGAESLMMLKEHMVENYGSIRYTFSSGPSGGSMMQNLIANSYPGILQGIIPMAEYIDYWGEASHEVPDCIQLKAYFASAPSLWTNSADRIAVYGHQDERTCNFYTANFPPSMDPQRGAADGVGSEVSSSLRYHPVTNPAGVRPVQEDYQVNYFGRRPASVWTAQEKAAGFGFAKRLYDNVGVQYGLKGLSEGKITAEQFVDLNEKIGGLDIDFRPQANRHQQDPGAAELAYRMGFMNDASQLNKVAIISVRLPDVDPISSHSVVHSFILGDRLKKAHGTTTNRVLWMIPGYEGAKPHELSFVSMDRWLAALEQDKGSGTLAEKIVRNKPADLADGCWAPDATSIAFANQVKDINQCTSQWYPVSGTPRIVAGNGSRDVSFVTKCQLKPLARNEYNVVFTDAQWARLQAAFPGGVCDYTKPDAAVTPAVPWLDFTAGPGGQPLTVGAPTVQ